MQIDVASYIGAVTREVHGRDYGGKPARVVIAVRSYETTPEDLWDALTNAERISRWFLPITGDLKLGGHYQLEGNASGTITACEPPRRLSVTWEFGAQVSWVNVSVAPEGEGARLELEHIVPVDDHWAKFGPGAVGVGWELALAAGLARHLASGGAAVDREEAAAWSASDEGKAFAAQSSAAWGRAHVASGEDETVAGAQADRTTAAYTGG